MAFLTKDQILAAQDLPRERVDVPEWGGEVYVRTLDGKEYAAFMKVLESGTQENFLKILPLTLVDEDGRRLFTQEDFDVLATRSGPVLARLAQVAARLNGFTPAAVEAIEKN